MNIPIASYKVEEKQIIVESVAILIPKVVITNNNEENYMKEIEYKQRQEFNDFLYEHYYKFNKCKLDPYIKNKLWNNFTYNNRNNTSIIDYLLDMWDKFEDEYL